MSSDRLPFKARGRVPGSAVRVSRKREVMVVEVELYDGDRYAVELDAVSVLDLARALLANQAERNQT